MHNFNILTLGLRWTAGCALTRDDLNWKRSSSKLPRCRVHRSQLCPKREYMKELFFILRKLHQPADFVSHESPGARRTPSSPPSSGPQIHQLSRWRSCCIGPRTSRLDSRPDKSPSKISYISELDVKRDIIYIYTSVVKNFDMSIKYRYLKVKTVRYDFSVVSIYRYYINLTCGTGNTHTNTTSVPFPTSLQGRSRLHPDSSNKTSAGLQCDLHTLCRRNLRSC